MLNLVATPLGELEGLSPLATSTLAAADVILVESFKEAKRILRTVDLGDKPLEKIDEHSKAHDYEFFVQLCAEKNVALISDCGTPGFCDPGNHLVKLCRQKDIEVKTIAGPSSLAALLSLTTERLEKFYFEGFLPRDSEERSRFWKSAKATRVPIVIMDTPYRLQKTIGEMEQNLAQQQVLILCNQSAADEWSFEGTAAELKKTIRFEKAEFIILIYPAGRR